ncbi:MAG: hypothetical protein ICV53_08985, partial [Flavisolibacter sp.]|nr:hypothetical protein [Flavisolibacter sp.]
NILLPNIGPYRTKEYGYEIGAGVPVKTGLASFLLSYELRPNLFLESNLLIRRQSSNYVSAAPQNTSVFSVGVRWNTFRREFDF